MAMPADNREAGTGNGNSPIAIVPPPPGPGEESGSLVWYLNVLSEGRWLVLAALVAAGLGLVAYLGLATPIYESDVVVQVEELRSSATKALEDLPTALMGRQTWTETEMEVLRSRTLVGSVVDDLELNISAGPRRVPFLGRVANRLHAGKKGLAGPWLGMTRYACRVLHLEGRRSSGRPG
jgi:tyrosine-protein kinase Etk/Wzc